MSFNRNMSNNFWGETRLNRKETIAITEFTTNATNLIMHFCHIESLTIMPFQITLFFKNKIKFHKNKNVVECYQTILVTLYFYCMDKNVLNLSNYVPQKKLFFFLNIRALQIGRHAMFFIVWN